MSNKPLLSLLCAGMLFSNCLYAENLTLSQAYALALAHEPKLRAAAYRAEATQEAVNQTQARLRPQVQGSLSWGKYGYDAAYLKKPVNESYSSYSFSASQPLYRPDLWRAVDESQARAEGSQYDYQTKAQQLGMDVAKAYFELMRSQRNLDLARAQKEYYESKYRQLDEMLKNGLTNRIDVLEARIHRDHAAAEWLTESKRSGVARLKLEHMTGEAVSDLSEVDLRTITPQSFPMERGEWESKLDANPALKASESAVMIARHQLALREYEHYPKVDLSLMRKETYTQDTIAHTYDNQAVVQMNIPIYQGGYTQSRVREGLKLLDSANQEIEFTRKDTRLRFEAAWSEYTLLAEKIALTREAETSAKLFLESVEQGQKAGLKSVVDVLEAQSKLYQVRRDFIDAGYEFINNHLALLDVTGQLNAQSIENLEAVLSRKQQ